MEPSLLHCIHMRLQQRGMSYIRHKRSMETPSAENIQREATRSPGRSKDQLFARFLDAANQLGEHLDTIFTTELAKIVANPSLIPHPVGKPTGEKDRSSRKNVYDIEPSSKKGANSLGEKTAKPQSPSPSLGIKSSLVVRLHFAEAMMVLMFNALSEPQQASIKQHFDDLLKRSESVEVMGVLPSTFQAYRDALRAMQNMLASNPTPEEMAVALATDFAKRCNNNKGNGTHPPRSAG